MYACDTSGCVALARTTPANGAHPKASCAGPWRGRRLRQLNYLDVFSTSTVGFLYGLESVQTLLVLHIVNNRDLEDLSGLANLVSVSGQVTVTGNPNLDACMLGMRLVGPLQGRGV